MSIKTIFFLIIPLLVSCSGPSRLPLAPLSTLIVSKDNIELLSAKSPLGNWTNFSQSMKNGWLALDGESPFSGVSYQARFGLENMERFSKEKAKYQNLLASNALDMKPDISKMERYSGKNRQEVGILSVQGLATKIKTYKCQEIRETQNFGPAASDSKWGGNHSTLLTSETSCPLIIDGELWQLYSFYRVDIRTNEFNKSYGVNPPSLENIRKDIQSRMQPMHDSVQIFHNPTQTLPEGYR